MALTPGSRVGVYEIRGLLGVGGMGEVYRAHDDRLKREVAIKVLPALVATDPERLERFQREAQALAALNHPHIAQVFGLETTSGVVSGKTTPDVVSYAIVMELVDGPTLAEVIAGGGHSAPAVTVADALPIARQIADALEAAHDKGIIHRDLKPANIKLTADGVVKVLDFGLAKALTPDSGSGTVGAMNSPTLTARATQMGVILGTAAYMAPEQARGRPVDKRADIWAFGAVLFELVTGRRAFDGDELTDVLARVIERDPDWSLLPSSTPPALRSLLERCLTKDAKARLRDIGEARHTLDELISGKTSPNSAHAPAATARRRAAAWLPWAIAAIFAVLAGVALMKPADRGGTASRLTRVELSLPSDVEFYASPRISPDGTRVAFVGVREGIRQMYIRDLAQAETRPINGTESAISIAFSPDSASAGVITTDGRLKRVTLGTGSVEEMATGVDIVGGLNWSSDGKLLFGQVTRLVFVPATGGPVTEIVAADKAAGETSLVNPVPTPDGKHVVFTSWAGTAGALRQHVEVVSIDGGDRRVIMEDAGYVVAARPDRLLFQRGDAVYSVPFDAVRAAVSGVPTRLTNEATSNPAGGLGVDLTASGDLLFAEARLFTGRLVWVSHEGIERVLPVPARAYANPRVSPDGRTVAYSESAAIWTADVERGAQTRIFVGNDGVTGFATWAADGAHLFFRSASGVSRVRADGEGKPDLLPGTLRQDYPNSVSPDGKWLGMTRILSATLGDVVLLPLGGGEARVVVGTNAYEGGVQFSPDGKWLAYVSNSSGRMEVYLRSIDGADRYPVSTTGGLHPLWSRDGRQIYFRNGQQMLAVDVTASPAVHLSAPKLIFERRYAFGPNLTIANYGLSKDGREFLMVREDGGGSHLSLIFNWLSNGGR